MNESVHDDRPPAEKLNAVDLPRVALFLDGFFRGDLAREHGSPAGAAYDYAAGAELDELGELTEEWRVVLAAARVLPPAVFREAFRKGFPDAWEPVSLADVEAIAAELESAVRE